MKYQVFLFSFFCFFSSTYSMEKNSEKSLHNSAQVADALQRYATYVLAVNPIVNEENLATNIAAVRQSPMTDRQCNDALLLIMDEHMALIHMYRQAWAEQEDWRIEDHEPSKKRRKIN